MKSARVDPLRAQTQVNVQPRDIEPTFSPIILNASLILSSSFTSH